MGEFGSRRTFPKCSLSLAQGRTNYEDFRYYVVSRETTQLEVWNFKQPPKVNDENDF